MAFIMVEVALQRILQKGINNLRNDPDAFNDIFSLYLSDEMKHDYGESYVDRIRQWFFTTRIPVVQSWSFSPNRIPCFSIHLSSESEDEAKAAIGDYFGETDDFTVTTGVFTVTADIAIHSDRNSDQTLWLYYIMSYIMFKEKRTAERLGIQLHTWSASDYNKESRYMAENIWTRWVRVRCTTQNYLKDKDKEEYDVEIEVDVDNE